MEMSRQKTRQTQKLFCSILLVLQRIKIGSVRSTHLHEFQTNKAEPLLFKTFDDLSHKPPLDPIRLDGNEGAFTVGHGPGERQAG